MPIDKAYSIIDAWAQHALVDALKKMPEIARLFKQSGSSHLLEAGLTAEQIVEEEAKENFLYRNAQRVFNLAAR